MGLGWEVHDIEVGVRRVTNLFSATDTTLIPHRCDRCFERRHPCEICVVSVAQMVCVRVRSDAPLSSRTRGCAT